MVLSRRSELVEYGSPEDTGKLIGERRDLKYRTAAKEVIQKEMLSSKIKKQQKLKQNNTVL